MIKNFIGISIATILLCWVAFNNKYPLLSSVTGEFINSGFIEHYHPSLTIFYGKFVVLASFSFSLWLVVLFQALLLSLILLYYFKFFLSKKRAWSHLISYTLFCAIFSSCSIVVSTIGPGIFTVLSILGLGLLLFAEIPRKIDAYAICIITACSISSSYLNIIVSLCSIILFIAHQFKGIPKIGLYKAQMKFRVVSVFFVQIFALTLALLPNYFLGFKEEKLGTFLVSNVNSNNAVNITTPDRLLNVLSLQVRPYKRLDLNTDAVTEVQNWFKWEVREYRLSRQFWNMLDFNQIGIIQLCIFLLILTSFFFINKRFSAYFYPCLDNYILLSIVLAGILNAVVNFLDEDITWQILWLMTLPLYLRFFTAYSTPTTNKDHVA